MRLVNDPRLRKETVKVASKTNITKLKYRWMHTRWGHYTPCLINGHELLVTRVTHPPVTLHENIKTLLVLVRVENVTHEP